MNKLTKKCLSGAVYISPEIKAVEIKAEGMLCVSALSGFYTLGGGGQYTDDFINPNGEY